MSPYPGDTDYDKQKKGGREREDTYFIIGTGRARGERAEPGGVSFLALLLDKLIRLADNWPVWIH